jgi:hypothetical protein
VLKSLTAIFFIFKKFLLADMSFNESTTVTLKGPDDWDAWAKQFKAEATRRSLLEHIEGTKPFLAAPVLPEPRAFGQQTQPPTTGTISISELSADGRSNFQLALSYYKAQKDLYDGERDALDKLQTWMTKTVASNYAQTCFDYSDGIKEWYGKLKEQVSMNEHSIKREIKVSYRQAVRPLSKPPKDFEAWITNWEQVMAKGINRDIPFAKDVDEWFDDFLNAVISVKPSWVEAYRLTKAAEVELSTLSYRTLANDFRKAVKLPGPNARSSRIAKGSFGPTFAGQEAEEMAYAPDASTQGAPERRRRTRTQKRRRSRETSISTGRVICRACGQRHDLHVCYYLFPSKAPDGFREREAMRRTVDQNLKEDHVLAEEVNRIQKSMDKGKEKPGDDRD